MTMKNLTRLCGASSVAGIAVAAALLGTAGVVRAGGAAAAVEDAPLIDAVRAGDSAAVESLLANGVSLRTTEIDGTTALHWAAHHDRLTIAGLLLDAGAVVDAANRYGVTPLALASVNGSTAMITRLLEAGADPNLPNPEGETPLMTAARTGNAAAIDTLLAHGAEVDAVEAWRGQTALMWAAAQNQAEAVEALLAAGADPHARSARGFTPLLFAAREGHVDVLDDLVRTGADVDDALPANGMSALVLAVYNAQYDFANALLERGADPDAAGNGWTALHQLVWTRRPNLGRNPPFPVPLGQLDAFDLARALAAHGADLDARQTQEPRDGNRNMLKRIGSTPFLQAAKVADVEMMRLLVELGADASRTTDEGVTPLMAAAGVGIWKIGENPGSNEQALAAVELAWELGNDVNAADTNGDTALHGAIHRGAGNIVRFLVDKGANIDAVNGKGWSALSVAQGVFYPNTFNRHPELVTLLTELGADPSAGSRRPEDLSPAERLALAQEQEEEQ
ncbi:MAG: ankyrin repeat domain-containing protein [Acidobacteria bacterium]|nr:ankyrin repeat domain-containing protein [Acidobacteriota bacterium]